MTETRHDDSTEPGVEAGNRHRSGMFLKGFVGGALIGAAAGVVCAPHMYVALRRFRRRLMDVDDSPATRYQHVTAQVGGTFDDLEQKGRTVAEKAPSVVARGAGDVEDRLVERKTETVAGNTR
jgi:gas vesicle protein